MAQQIKPLATKSDSLSSDSQNPHGDMVEGDTASLKLSSDLYMCVLAPYPGQELSLFLSLTDTQ